MWNILLIAIVLNLIHTSFQSALPDNGKNASSTLTPGFLSVARHCIRQDDMFKCFKKQAIVTLEKAISNKESWFLNDYISLRRDPNWKEISGNQGAIEKDLNSVLSRKIQDLVESRTIQLSFAPDINEEGRKKKDKNGGMMMISGFAMIAMLLQLALGKIAFLAGAALLIAKLALLLSALVGLKKLIGGGSGGESHVVVAEHGHGGGGGGYGGGGWQRSIDPKAQDLAYRGHLSIEDGI